MHGLCLIGEVKKLDFFDKYVENRRVYRVTVKLFVKDMET